MKIFIIYFMPVLFMLIEIPAQVITETVLYNTKSIQLHSKVVNDDYLIFISVPDDYETSTKSYPVIYVLDGDVAFGMLTSIARYLQVGNNIPELIVVGIGYGSMDQSAGEKRRRDYRPASSGGAENFLNFLKNELIPYIDQNYRTIPGERTINGYAIGGLFAFYTLFTQPDTFDKYIIGSPYLLWDNSSIFSYEENSFQKIGERKINVFISVGSEESEERYFNPIDEMVSIIQSRNYTGLKLDTKVFSGGTHLLCPPEAITYGLMSVFKE